MTLKPSTTMLLRSCRFAMCAACLVLGTAVSPVACSEPTQPGKETKVIDHPDLAAVAAYVAKTRGWKSGDYRVEQRPNEGKLLVFWVLHRDDEKSMTPGGGKSFELRLDPATHEPIGEFHFQ